MNIQEGRSSNSSYEVGSNFKIPNAQSFSREYVFEIKVYYKNYFFHLKFLVKKTIMLSKINL